MMATRTIFSWACSLSLLDTFVEKNRGLKPAQTIKFLLNFNIVMVMQNSDAKNQGAIHSHIIEGASDLCENSSALVTMTDFFEKIRYKQPVFQIFPLTARTCR